MCGICGVWNLKRRAVNPEFLLQMRDSMEYRGPDGAGCVLCDTINRKKPVSYETLEEYNSQLTTQQSLHDLGFGHRRLSIIDLSTGDQPMSDISGSVWIVFNGEIYNYREIRSILEAQGYIFRTTSDTEVILFAYMEYGTDCCKHFKGIFAFAIWDASKKSLFVARDHFGVKPLYYYYDSDRFYFASEVKALLCDPSIQREPDINSLNLCLTLRHTPSPRTLFKNIFKLPPGTFMIVTENGIREVKYRDDNSVINHEQSESDWIDQLQIALEQSITRQMMSDVPIGVSLSSGIDSTTILALMRQHYSGSINAFTVGFAGREKTSEIEPAKRVAVKYGAEFTSQIITSQDYSDFMRNYMWHLEEPTGNESAAAYYFVANMAKMAGIKVLLTGQGADEPFAGYERYLWAAYGQWLRTGSLSIPKWLLSHTLSGTALGEQYHRFLSIQSASSEAEQFLCVYSILSDEMKQSLIKQDIFAEMDKRVALEYVEEQLANAPNGTPLERMTFVDTRTSLPDNLLLCGDKMAMAAGVEARVPLLDLDLMRVAESIPGRYKLKGLRDKYIHRKACKKWVGKGLASRPKIGFDNAVDAWLRSQLGEHMKEFVQMPDSFTHTYLDMDYVMSLMHEHADSRRDHQRILFLIMSLESWYRVFIKT